MKLDMKLKIPVRGLQFDVGNGGQDDGRFTETKRPIRLNPNNHNYGIANSCNGLLCLCERFKDKPAVVCNPVTVEFINLPQHCPSDKHHTTESSDEMSSDDEVIPGEEEKRNIAVSYCGLGFSPKDNQYKVIRTFGRLVYDFLSWNCHYSRSWVAEVHKLGTSSWVRINDAPCNNFGLTPPTYAKGSFYWFPTHSTPFDFPPLEMYYDNYFIISFDFDIEKFSSIPLPPTCHSELNKMGMGVLRGSLCVFGAHPEDPIVIWELKDDATEKYWTKLLSIETDSFRRPKYRSFIPISYYNEEALTMLIIYRKCLVYYHPKNQHLRYFNICGRKSEFEVTQRINT